MQLSFCKSLDHRAPIILAALAAFAAPGPACKWPGIAGAGKSQVTLNFYSPPAYTPDGEVKKSVQRQ